VKNAAMVVSALIVLTGCANKMQDTGAYISDSSSFFPSSIDNLEMDAPQEELSPIPYSFDISINDAKLISDCDSYLKYLDSQAPLHDAFQIMLEPYLYSVEKQELAAYQLLKINGLTVADVEEELHNILVYSQNPTCCSTEMFDKLVGKLNKTLCCMANPFTSYYALSQRIHEFSCSKEHSFQYGIYTCDNLLKENEDMRTMTILESLEMKYAEDLGFQKIKRALLQNPDLSINSFLVELENLIQAQLNPSGMGYNSWFALFGNLNATLSYGESLYETYIELAVSIHNELYPDDLLTKNEYGIYVSKSLIMPKY